MYIGLVLAMCIWGTTYVINKASLNQLQPATLVFYRMGMASVLLLIYLLIKKKHPFKNFHIGMNLGLALWVVYIPQTISLQYTTASNSSFIVSMYVLMVPYISYIFLNTSISKRQILAIGTSLIGLWCISGNINGIKTGDWLNLIAALGVAIQLIMVSFYLKRNADPEVLTFQAIFFLCLYCLVTAILMKENLSFPNTQIMPTLAYLIIFPTFIAYLLLYKAQKYISPIQISLIGILEPVTGALFAWTYGKEHPLPSQLLGGVIILTSILITVLPKDTVYKYLGILSFRKLIKIFS
jgi:drug/metabolite transporter (DMT)-like permease